MGMRFMAPLRWRALLPGLLLAATPPLAAAQQGVEAPPKVKIKGSDTMLVLNSEWAARYERDHEEIDFEISGGGSGIGIEELLAGRADLAAASRRLHDDEIARFKKVYGSLPLEIPVAMDGIAFYVHNSNHVAHLSIEELRGILSGRIRNWSKVGGPDRPVIVFDRDLESGTREMVTELVLGGTEITAAARRVATTGTLVEAVSRTPGAIGYGGIAYARGAYVVKIVDPEGKKAIFPSVQTVSEGSYPLARRLYFYVNPRSWTPAVQRFVRWVLSEEAQEITLFVGYFPLDHRSREAALGGQDAAKKTNP